MKHVIPVLATICALAVPVTAHADTFNFTSTGSGFNASGVLTTTDTLSNGAYTVIGIQ